MLCMQLSDILPYALYSTGCHSGCSLVLNWKDIMSVVQLFL